MARDASRPDALWRQRCAGTVKDAGGTAKRREPQAIVLDGPEHRGSYPHVEIIHRVKFK